MLAVAAALRWEVRPVLRRLSGVKRVDHAGVRAWCGWHGTREILVFRTGVGPRQAESATRAVLSSYGISALVNTGCAGALDPDLTTETLVVPHTVIEDAPSEDATAFLTHEEWARTLREAAHRAGLSLDAGPLLTCARPLLTADDKRSNRRRFGATAVDMESAAVARVTRESGIPFSCARIILDTADHELPDLGGTLGPDGSIRPLHAAGVVARNPRQLLDFVDLARLSRRAEKGLDRLFGTLFEAELRCAG